MAAEAIALSDEDFAPADVQHPVLSDADFSPDEIALSDADFANVPVEAPAAVSAPADESPSGLAPLNAREFLQSADPTMGQYAGAGAIGEVAALANPTIQSGEDMTRALNSPLITLPKPEGDAWAGVRKVEEVIEGLTTPVNVALLASLGGAPAAIKTAASTYFAATMGKEAAFEAKHVVDAIKEEGWTSPATGEALVGAGANALLATAAGTHAAGRPKSTPVEKTQRATPSAPAQTAMPEARGDIPVQDRINAIDYQLAGFEQKLGPREEFDPGTKKPRQARILDHRETELLKLRDELQANSEVQDTSATSVGASEKSPSYDGQPVKEMEHGYNENGRPRTLVRFASGNEVWVTNSGIRNSGHPAVIESPSAPSPTPGTAESAPATVADLIAPEATKALAEADAIGKSLTQPAPEQSQPELRTTPKYRSAAVQYSDGSVFEGRFHADAEAKAERSGGKNPATSVDSGYVTQDGRYVSSAEANKVIDKAKAEQMTGYPSATAEFLRATGQLGPETSALRPPASAAVASEPAPVAGGGAGAGKRAIELVDPIPEHSAAVVKVAKNKPQAELVRGMAEKAREDVKNLGPGAANAAEFAKLREESAREHATIGASHLMEGKTGKPEWLDAMREEYGMSEATPKELNKIWREAHEMVADFEGAQSGRALRPKAQIEQAVKPLKETVTMTEKAALKMQMKTEEKGFKRGVKTEEDRTRPIMERLQETLANSVSKAKALAGYLTGMEKGAKLGGAARQAQIRMADKWMAADYAQTRADLLDFAKNLPPDQRGKFIPAITEALKRIPVLSKNAPELLANRAVDVMNRITAAVYDVNRKQTIGKIEKLLEKNEEAKNITVPERQMIRQRGVTFNALKDKMSLDMLEAMHERMKEIRDAGKELFVLDEVVKAEKVKATIREIQTQGVRKIDTPEQLRVALGETETTWARRLNELRRVPEFIKHFNLAWTPFDWLVQTFDKSTGGAIRRTMKLPVDVLYGEWLDSSTGFKKPLREIARRNKLTPGNLDRIGVHAELRQEGGLENIQSKGYTKKEIDSARTLTKGELEFLRESDRINNEIMPQVEKVLADYFHTEIEKVQGYFPRQRDWDYYSTLSIEEGRFAQAHNRTNTEKGSTISRVGAVTQNRTNALDIMEKHIDDALYHIKLGPEIRRLADTVKTPEFAESTGTWGQKVFSDWVDVLSRNGGVGSGRRIPAMDVLRKNIGMAQLAWRLTTTALQPLSLIQGMAVVSPKNMGRALSMMARKDTREYVLKNFPEIRHRVGDDPAYSDYGGASIRDKWARGGFYGISKLDRLSAMTTGLGKYLDSLEAAGVKFDPASPVRMESVQDAQLAVRQTQSSTFPKDLPLAISRGNFSKNASVDKALGQFQNFLINKWALTKNGALQMGIEEKSPRAGARIMAFLILGTVAEQLGREGIRRGIQATLGQTDQQKQDDKKAKKEGDVFAMEIAKRSSMDLVTGMPIVSNIAGVAKYDGSGLPLLDVPKNIIEGGVKIATGAHTSTKAAGAIRATQGIGAVLGVPTGQIGDVAVQVVRANKKKIDENDKKKPKKASFDSKL